MHIDKTDLQLSTKYQSLMKKANNINQYNIDLYKKKFSDKVEINLFLNQKEVIKNLTLFKQDSNGEFKLIKTLETTISDGHFLHG